jgi:hypothetical protein
MRNVHIRQARHGKLLAEVLRDPGVGSVASPASTVVLAVTTSSGGTARSDVAEVEAGVEGVASLGADVGKCVASVAGVSIAGGRGGGVGAS